MLCGNASNITKRNSSKIETLRVDVVDCVSVGDAVKIYYLKQKRNNLFQIYLLKFPRLYSEGHFKDSFSSNLYFSKMIWQIPKRLFSWIFSDGRFDKTNS